MNPDKTHLRALLDDLLTPSGETRGPNRADVLTLLRTERVRRRRQQAGSAAAAACAVLMLVLSLQFWKSPAKTVPSPVAAVHRPPAPAPLVIDHVNDEQLMALLHDTPSALMKWPNGDRTLLVLQR